MKMVLTTARSPDEYIDCLAGWQQSYIATLRTSVRTTCPELEERLKWGHIVYLTSGPVLLLRAEPARVLFGFWRGQRLRDIEPRLKPGGKYEMATLEIRQETSLTKETVTALVSRATSLNHSLGDPTIGSLSNSAA